MNPPADAQSPAAGAPSSASGAGSSASGAPSSASAAAASASAAGSSASAAAASASGLERSAFQAEPPALEVEGLHVSYGELAAVSDVSFSLATSETLVILGRNGAGKSSLLRSVAGLVKPASGRIRLFGRDIAKRRTEARVRQGLTLVPEGRQVFANLTVQENLVLGGFLADGADFAERYDYIFELFPRVSERLAQRAGSLSGGEQQMLAIARALMAKPSVLLLDEPSLGLAPLVVDEVYEHLQELKRQELTIVLVEQQVQRALAMADQAIVMSLGEIALRESPSVLASDPRLAETYLGE